MQGSVIKNNQYNIGYICTAQQCLDQKAGRVAFRWIGANNDKENFTFSELDNQSNKVANLLENLSVSKGEKIFIYLPKLPEVFFIFLGILKKQAVAGTLFSNFGETSLLDRLKDAGATIIFTRKSLLKNIQNVSSGLPYLKYIIVLDIDTHISGEILSYTMLMKTCSGLFETLPTEPSVPSVLHYTSGSTGKPKGVLHKHQSVILQSYTAEKILSLTDDDIYWCTADPGWVTGTSYGIIGPWSLGITQVHNGGIYNAAGWFGILQDEGVTIWYTSPTALRMLMRENTDLFRGYNLDKLKYIFSVGEPLNPEVVKWCKEVLGKEVFDTWFQTETGSIMISNRPGLKIKPGSMGKPIEKIEAAIITDEGSFAGIKQQGHLCLKSGWDSMFVTYLNNTEVYDNKFKDGYYYSGDKAYIDNDGYYWFIGRNDDVINTAGHLISPFEIESALLEIPEIAESSVIGAPDEVLYEKIIAYVRLHKNIEWSGELEMKIRINLANQLSSTAIPKEIIKIDEIPKNKSGKIMRRVLKALYKGEDPGDISTLDI